MYPICTAQAWSTVFQEAFIRISAEGLAFLAEKPSDLEVYRKTCGLIKQRNPRNTTKNRVESKIDERQDEEEIKSPQEMIEDSIEEDVYNDGINGVNVPPIEIKEFEKNVQKKTFFYFRVCQSTILYYSIRSLKI